MLVLYALLAVAVVAWLLARREGDATRLRHRLESLGALLEKGGPEGNLEAANKGRQVGGYFCREFSIEMPPFGLRMQDRGRLAQVALGYRRGAESITVVVRGVQVEVQPGNPKGAAMTAEVAVAGRVDGSARREAYRFSFRWLEEDGEWCIEQAEMLEVLEGLDGLF
jgi:hypothetical protein